MKRIDPSDAQEFAWICYRYINDCKEIEELNEKIAALSEERRKIREQADKLHVDATRWMKHQELSLVVVGKGEESVVARLVYEAPNGSTIELSPMVK